MNNNFEIRFTATSSYTFTGNFFRRKRFEPFVFELITQYLPSPLKYPVKITIYGDKIYGVDTIKFYNSTQLFKFTNFTREGSFKTFQELSIGEKNIDGSVNSLCISPQKLSYATSDTTHAPFQDLSITFKKKYDLNPLRIETYRNLIYQLQYFLEDHPSFNGYDVIKKILETLQIRIEDIDILNITDVIQIWDGKLVFLNQHSEDTVVEFHFDNDRYSHCILKRANSVLTEYSDDSLEFICDIQNTDEKKAELHTAMKEIIAAKKRFPIPGYFYISRRRHNIIIGKF